MQYCVIITKRTPYAYLTHLQPYIPMTSFGFRRPCHATLSTWNITRKRALRIIDAPRLVVGVVGTSCDHIVINRIKYKRRLTVYYFTDNLTHSALHLYYIIVRVQISIILYLEQRKIIDFDV